MCISDSLKNYTPETQTDKIQLRLKNWGKSHHTIALSKQYKNIILFMKNKCLSKISFRKANGNNKKCKKKNEIEPSNEN